MGGTGSAAHTTGRPVPGDVVAGKYRIEGVLGRGGMGIVYEAVNQLTERRVALKWMLREHSENAEHVERLLREARAAGRIDHPNVVSIFDVGTEGEVPFLVMELLQGESLAQMMERAPIATADAIEILMPAFRGIAAAHTRGIVHRDLKPENIFIVLDEEGAPADSKVLDFGISKVQDKLEKALTETGAVMGTPHYMSPEQVMGVRELDHLVDVYALGVILYEVLADELPHQADTRTALAVKIATMDPMPLHEKKPEVPAELSAVVARAMSRAPKTRYPDVASLAKDLEPFAPGVKFAVRRTVKWSGPNRMLDRNAPTGPLMRRRATGENESGTRPRVSPDTPTMGSASGAMPAVVVPVVVPAIEPVAPVVAAAVPAAATPAPPSKRPVIVGLVALAVIVLGLIALFAGGVFDSEPAPLATPEPQPAVTPPVRAPDPEPPPRAAVQTAEPAPEPIATPEPTPEPAVTTTETPHATPRRPRTTGTAAPETTTAPTKRARGRRAASLSADEF